MKTLYDEERGKYKQGKKKSVIEAVWQYVMDHSEEMPNGELFIKFHIKDKNTFYKRIHARMGGLYRSDTEMANLIKDRKTVTLDQNKMANAIANLKNQKPKRVWWRKILAKI